MDGAEVSSARIGESRVGREKISGKPGVRIVPLAGNSLAIRANLIGRVFDGEKLGNTPTDHSLAFAAQQLTQSLVAAQDAPLGIVNQDGVTDRVERVFPLAAHGGNLLKQTHIFQRHPKQVGHIHKIGKLAGSEAPAFGSADSNDTQSPIFPWKRKRYQ